MTSLSSAPLSHRFAAGWAALLIFITCGYFQNHRPGWNVNSQFALTCAIAERGTLAIDAYLTHPEFGTEDRALFGGKSYSDKSPVTAFMGVPVVWCYRQVCQWRGVAVDYAQARWWSTWLIIGGSAAAVAALLTLLLIRRGTNKALAAMAASALIVASPLMGYAVLFFNYLPSCALALLGWWLVEPLWLRPSGITSKPVRLTLLGGLCLGLATWTLNTQAVTALVLTVCLVFTILQQRDLPRTVLPAWIAGGLLGSAGYFAYNYAIFHSFGSPYAYEADPFFREQMARGLMGATQPRAIVAWLITFHPYRGIFFWFPCTLLALLGCLLLLTRRPPMAGERTSAAGAVAVFALLVLYTSAYFMWWGGWSYSVRHLLPAVPLLGLGLAPWLRGGAWPRRVLLLVALLGAIVNLSMVALDPQFPPMVEQDQLLQPARISDWPIPQWRQLRYVWQGWQVDRNFGTVLHLPGPLSLLPLAFIWLLAVVMLARRVRKIPLSPSPAEPTALP